MKQNQLTARKIAAAKKPGYYGDGGGLYLQVSPSGTKSWVFRFMMNRRNRDMGLGSLNTFTLKEARERARRCRQLVAEGIDPIEDLRARRDRARAEATENMMFKDASRRFIELHAPTWKNIKHRGQWSRTLEVYAYPKLGTRPVSALDGAAITDALQGIWLTKIETASRVKQRIERICQWVKDGMPLPQQGASRRVQHYEALPFGEMPAFMAELRERNSVSARALEFTILTAARTSESIRAKWDEIDFKNGVWTVPVSRMKAGKDHKVPLSKRVIEILKSLPRERGDYLFMGGRAGEPLSNWAMLELLKNMKPGLTVHGFRSTFRDWAGDRSRFDRETIEHALAHKLPDKVEAAYRRGTALEKRALLDAGLGGLLRVTRCQR